MTRLLSFTLLVLVALAAGCTYPNQFQNVRTDSPHAVLVGDGVKLTHINDQPTSFWRPSERFRISPGLTTVRVIAGYRGDVHYPLIRFTAEAGHSYSAQRQHRDGADRVVLQDGGEHVVAQAERQTQ